MSPGGVAARRRFGGAGFALGCGCRDATAVAVPVSAPSPCSATEASTATTATSRRSRTHPSASASTGTLTVPSASSSSFPWEDADGDEVGCGRDSAEYTPSFSGLLRELSELERSVKSCGRKSPRRNYFSPPPPLPSRPAHGGDKHNSKEDHGNLSPLPPHLPLQPRVVQHPPEPSGDESHGSFSPPPPLPLPSRPVQQRAVHSGDKRISSKEGDGNFSPPRPRAPPVESKNQQHRRALSVDKVNRQEGDGHATPPPPLPFPLQQLRDLKAAERGNIKEDAKHLPPPPAPKHRKAKSCDNNAATLDGSVAVVKQSEDPLGDFRRSMVSMMVENGIVTGEELRELLRRFLALNAPHHHDAILRAFTEIWEEVFAATADPKNEPARPKAPRQRTPPRRRQPPQGWRF